MSDPIPTPGATRPPPPLPASADEAETLPPAAPPSEGRAVPPGPDATGPAAGDGARIPGYVILSTLGRGGMGVVYQARQEKLGRVVALKMILAGAHAGAADLARFKTEAEAIARLQHPHIVQVYEVGEHGGLPYFSLEFCAGGSLERKLSGTPLPPAEAAALAEALARAMQAAHEKGVIHRDLKPANVLLTADGTPKVSDFGLARRLDTDRQTATGAVMGTPSYMAPEQAEGTKEVGPAADVYALGAVLYECLTGRPPFRAATAYDTILQVVGEAPVPPRRVNAQVPAGLEAVCLKCLEKDPRRRYGSAGALAEDLGRYLAGEPISARSLNLVSRVTSALEHSHYDVRFRAYSTIIFGFAFIMLLAEVAKWLAFARAPTLVVVSAVEAARLGSVLGLVVWLRPSGLRSTSAAERMLWSVWVGYVITLWAMGLAHWIDVGGWVAAQEYQLYPPIAAATGLAFFVLGCSYWGWCYALGLAFHALALLMALDLRWAPLEFGALWAAALVIVGIRLRRLGTAEQPAEKPIADQALPAPPDGTTVPASQAVPAAGALAAQPLADGRVRD
jgi:serine/threonine-protein kinase